MYRFLVAFFLTQSFHYCYQQNTNVCPIGSNYYNGVCIKSGCPDTHYLVNGACLLRPRNTGTASCGHGFDLINDMCVQQNCPMNFVMINGLCQPTINTQPILYCPHGFSAYNSKCFPNPGIITPPFCLPKPCATFYCPFTCDENTATPATTTTTTSTTTSTAAPDLCAEDNVFIDGECRFVYCLKGTLHRGRCLEPVCSHGLVWTGLKCTHPEVITTILEIENNIITDTNQTGPDFHASKSIDNVVYVTESYEASTEGVTKSCTPTSSMTSYSNKKCCIIISPRMCKKYTSKWVCFNRQYRQCGEVCGAYSIKYLKVPKVLEYPEMLVMPPNPTLENCHGNDCKPSDFVDCSGCSTNQKQTCLPYCYKYRCPSNRCTFIDQSEYCTKYRGSPGCSSFDGCFESFCNTGNESPNECI